MLTSKGSDKVQDRLQTELARIFTPGRPIEDPRLFSGRQTLLGELKAELADLKLSLILYGERGVGKTSFCNILLRGYRSIASHTCSSNDDFMTIYFNILSTIGEQFTESEIEAIEKFGYQLGKKDTLGFSGEISAGTTSVPVADPGLHPNFVLGKLKKRQKDLEVIVLDEFQNLESTAARKGVLEVIKALADSQIDIRTMVVGAARSDEELFAGASQYGQYKLRYFVASRIPRMDDNELADITDRRADLFKVKFDEDVRAAIVRISSGYPSVAHRVALYSARNWVLSKVVVTTLPILLRAISLVTPLLGPLIESVGEAFLIKRVGLNVEQADLKKGVEHYTKMVRSNYPDVVAQVDEILKSDRERNFRTLLETLASENSLSASIKNLVKDLNIPSQEVTTILDQKADKVVDRVDGTYSLKIPSLISYIRAQQYLRGGG